MRRLLVLLLLVLSVPPVLHAALHEKPIELSLDARDAPRKLLHAKMRIPASPGALTLVYPKWLPGEHGPTGPVTDLVGLQISAGGKPVAWHRDPVDMYAFHVDVPAGADAVEVAFDFLSPSTPKGFSSAASATPPPGAVDLEPGAPLSAGRQVRRGDVQAQPAAARRLEVRHFPGHRPRVGRGDRARAGLPDRARRLAGPGRRALPGRAARRPGRGCRAPHRGRQRRRARHLSRADRGAPPAGAAGGCPLRRRHFERYRFLLTLSNHVAHFGLEHHQSNDTRMSERALVDDTLGRLSIWILSHEYVHSWNGKHRRPAGLATPNYQEPMQGELLWVYEGLTQYLGNLLAARSGLFTTRQYHERLARIAADLDHRPGRTWRPLVDTAVAAQLLYAAPDAWASYRRGVDFYNEGWLIWLDVDTLIREQTRGRRSLDDFCRSFLGGASGPPAVKTYTVDDVVKALNEVHPYDWRAFLMDRVSSTGDRPPLGGIERGGYRLVYNDQRNQLLEDVEDGDAELTDAGSSIGIRVNEEGEVQDAIPGTPAYTAGLAPGMKVIAVNGRRFSPDVLRDALRSKSATLTLLIENQELFTQVSFPYEGSLREPHLERDESKPALLDQILAPLPARASR